jgi:hypothetical protein
VLAPRDAKRRGGEQRQSTAGRAIDGCIEFDERRLRQGSVDCPFPGSKGSSADVRFVGGQPASGYVSSWPQAALITWPRSGPSSGPRARLSRVVRWPRRPANRAPGPGRGEPCHRTRCGSQQCEDAAVAR